MQYKGPNVWRLLSATAKPVGCVMFLALAQMGWAQPISLASAERIQSAPRVVELRGEPAGDELNTARTAYRQGNIVRLTNASDDLIHRVAKGAVTVNRSIPREGIAKAGTRPV